MIRNVASVTDLPEAAEVLLSSFSQNKVFAFYGTLGAGKTTFIKEICRQLGIVDNVSSPTFALINQYMKTDGTSVYHFDFYRIKDASEALDIGFEEYVYSGDYCFIEWPEKIAEYLPEDHIAVKINEDDKGNRIITAAMN